jgi:hypothetical protein
MNNLLKSVFTIGLGLVPLVTIANENTTETVVSTSDAMQELEQYFYQQLDAQLKVQGVDILSLAKERESIFAEEDKDIALKRAQQFYNTYQPFYLKALISMKLDDSAIKEVMLNPAPDASVENMLRIIRTSNRCNSPLMIAMCSQMHARGGGCLAETYPMVYSSHFNVLPPVNGNTSRQLIYGHVDGTLRLWASNVDGLTSGVIGATVNVRPNTGMMCVQTQGTLNSLAVATYRYHYLDTSAYSHAILVPKVKFSQAPAGRSSSCAQQGYPFGTYYYAQRQEGSVSVVGGGINAWLPSLNATCDYEGAPRAAERVNLIGAANAQFPYFVEDMAIFSPPANTQTMDVYYQGHLNQSYSGANSQGRIDFKFDNIYIIQIPR